MGSKILNACLAAAAGATITFAILFFESWLIRGPLAVATTVLVIVLWLDRDFRYARIASSIAGAYVCRHVMSAYTLQLTGWGMFLNIRVNDGWDYSLLFLFAISVAADLSINHGLKLPGAEQVFQLLRHLMGIYFQFEDLTKAQRAALGPASIRATTLRLLFALIALVVVAVCTTAVAMAILSDRPKSGYPQGVKLTVSPSHEDATYPFGLPLTITAKLGDQPVRVLVWSDPQYGTITVNDASSITYIGSRLGIEQITVRTELGKATESISIREPAIYIKEH